MNKRLVDRDMDENILEVQQLEKRFSGVHALKGINLKIRKGEVHALMGENGAGKSTFIKIITGLYQPTSGKIIFDGQQVEIPNVISAQKMGISTVYQELNMIPYLTVAENIFLGRYPFSKGGIDWKKMNAQAQKLLDDIGVDVKADVPLKEYTTAKQQLISIVRAVNFKAKLLILDEPTSSLDRKEVEVLFQIMKKLRRDGISIIFITHRLSEVYEVTDRISILKDGEYVGTWHTDELPEYELVKKMVGSESSYQMKKEMPIRSFDDKKVILEVKNLMRSPFVNGVSFQIHEGEIVGMAGLLGAGRTETVRLIFGCDKMDSGEIYVEGKKVEIHSPRDAMREGLAFVTENRREEGIFPDLSVEKNIAICSLNQILNRGLISSRKRRDLAKKYIDVLKIKTPNNAQHIRYLSGGNQQKCILGRWMSTKPKLIILDEPTRGIDIGAKTEIEKLIRGFSQEGISVIYISSEMNELVRNCDRVIVLRDGKQVGHLYSNELSEKLIMQSVAGQKGAN